MSNSETDIFVTWLRDAHAFECKVLTEMNTHADHATDYPELQAGIRAHIAETEQHRDTVQQLIESMGGETSTLKTAIGKVAGAALSASTSLAHDGVIKNIITEFTMKHTEIASYVSLLATAEHLQLAEAIPPLRNILRQEEAMADWLRNQMSVITLRFLHAQEEPVPA